MFRSEIFPCGMSAEYVQVEYIYEIISFLMLDILLTVIKIKIR